MLANFPMLNSVYPLSWLGVLVAAFILTHVTALSISLYLHRYSAHRAMELHPALCHFFRFWLWLTTGMNTKAWTAIHRKHHARCETEDDPHSPQVKGLKTVLLQGAELYRQECHNEATLERFGQGTPDDWLERNIYAKYQTLGIFSMLFINIILFGPLGITLWALQMIWTPLCAAGIINGVGHYFGYRNFECADASTNIIPWGFLIMGEELHNNHHTFAASAKFSVKPWEFDTGWLYIKLFSALGLAKVKRVPPQLHTNPGKSKIDVETVKALVRNRFEVMSQYSREVMKPVYDEVRKKSADNKLWRQQLSRRILKAMIREESLLSEQRLSELKTALGNDYNTRLKTVYQFKQELQAIWAKTTASPRELIEALQQWCKKAERTGIKSLQEFAASIRTYTLYGSMA